MDKINLGSSYMQIFSLTERSAGDGARRLESREAPQLCTGLSVDWYYSYL